jgi:hypothetical protein
MNIDTTLPIPLMIIGGVGLFIMSRVMKTPTLMALIFLGLYYGYERPHIHQGFREWLYGLSDGTEASNRVIVKENGLKKIRGIDLDTNMDPNISTIMKKLRNYRRYNKVSYDQGYTFIRRFMLSVREIESGILRPRQTYENAELFLKTAMNHLHSIIISIPERSINQQLHRSSRESPPPLNLDKVGHLCRELDVYCTRRLYNLSLLLNQDWAQQPDIYKNEIAGTEIKESNAHNIHEFH